MSTPTTPFDFADSALRFEAATRSYHHKAPDAHRVYDMIQAAAERQLATTAEARAIIAAGLEPALRSLVTQIAANAANPIADEIADALTAAP